MHVSHLFQTSRQSPDQWTCASTNLSGVRGEHYALKACGPLHSPNAVIKDIEMSCQATPFDGAFDQSTLVDVVNTTRLTVLADHFVNETFVKCTQAIQNSQMHQSLSRGSIIGIALGAGLTVIGVGALVLARMWRPRRQATPGMLNHRPEGQGVIVELDPMAQNFGMPQHLGAPPPYAP